MNVDHQTPPSAAPSPREQLALEFAEWIASFKTERGYPVFNAPYGVIQGLCTDSKGRKTRGVTFGISRVLDAHLTIYNPTHLVLRDNRHGDSKCSSLDEVKALIREQWNLK